MSLEKQIQQDIKAAMLAKEKIRLESLRAIKSAILLVKTADGAEDISDDAEETHSGAGQIGRAHV